MKKLLKKTLPAVIAILLLSNFSAYSQVTSSFTAQVNNSKDKAFLNWSTSSDLNVNYFLLERSTDGKNFDNEAMVFPDQNGNSNKSYSYDDDINNMNSELVYYRLNMIDAKGHSKYSEVIAIKIERDMQQAKMIVYPSANEVRIAIPESWQGRKVSFSVYNLNGEVVRAFTDTEAGQTESFDIAAVSAGIYIIKANCGVNSSVIQFIKAKE